MAASPSREIVQALAAPREASRQAVGKGPRAALLAWQQEGLNVEQTRAWMEKARLEAVLGSCKRSLPSVRFVCV